MIQYLYTFQNDHHTKSSNCHCIVIIILSIALPMLYIIFPWLFFITWSLHFLILFTFYAHPSISFSLVTISSLTGEHCMGKMQMAMCTHLCAVYTCTCTVYTCPRKDAGRLLLVAETAWHTGPELLLPSLLVPAGCTKVTWPDFKLGPGRTGKG